LEFIWTRCLFLSIRKSTSIWTKVSFPLVGTYSQYLMNILVLRILDGDK
jgi:hypothetical protein